MLLSPCFPPGRNHSSSSNGSQGGLGLGLDLGLVHSQSTQSIHDHEAVSSLMGFYSHCQEESSQKDLLALEKQALEKQQALDSQQALATQLALEQQQGLEQQQDLEVQQAFDTGAVDSTIILHPGDDEHYLFE